MDVAAVQLRIHCRDRHNRFGDIQQGAEVVYGYRLTQTMQTT